MDRLLTLKLEAIGCEAEASLNGVALARVNAARPRALVPIHEYTLAGSNRLELIVWPHPINAKPEELPAPLQVRSDGQSMAAARILLPRLGNPVDEGSARSLADLNWVVPAGESFEPPVRLWQDLQLPVSFPRWRWMDAPPAQVTAQLQQQAATMVEQFRTELGAGEFANFLTALRFRTEELAVAYQRPAEEATTRLRDQLVALHGAAAVWDDVDAEGLVLRPLAGGRLLELLGADGEPVLKTQADEQGRVHAFALRVAAVEGRLYVLR